MGGGREIGPERGVEVLACVSDPIAGPPLMMAPPSLAEEPCPTPRRTSEEVGNPAGLEETSAVPPTQWLVYSRCRPARVEEAQGGGSQPAAEDFISRITKTTTTVNAPPPIPKRRKKVLEKINNPHYLYRMTTLQAISLLAPVMGADITCQQVPNMKFNVAKVLQSLVPILDQSVVEKTVKPCLVELSEDPDVDVRYYANQALQACDQMVMSS
nr:unnamed protein product [Digitaria exilis]